MSAAQLPNIFTDPARVSGFGRLYAPDPRDGQRQFRMGVVVPKSAADRSVKKRWRLGPGRQFRVQRGSTCVGHGVTHLRLLTPFLGHNVDADFPYRAYHWAQANDEWDGQEPTYYGTSVRAGLQFLRKVDGSVASFHAAANMDEVYARVTAPKALGGGPLIVGTDFYAGCSPAPSADGTPKEWTLDGDYWGGHCYVVIGFDPKTATRPERWIVGNSHEGNLVGWMTTETLEYLLFQANGDCYAVVET